METLPVMWGTQTGLAQIAPNQNLAAARSARSEVSLLNGGRWSRPSLSCSSHRASLPVSRRTEVGKSAVVVEVRWIVAVLTSSTRPIGPEKSCSRNLVVTEVEPCVERESSPDGRMALSEQ
eukprot:CAMPEP_0205922006 /NCGR_PEP_ID=MMETSP1325-20131115/13789_1 /ASSEMBLY_ACC=CAM_ASM_000708 /TAXON_ID=236786 /ORGANISM="Florenciella sp., Strain RCC1007" /LENGTH=120 /DNA_ID=CAMNT_0053289951 /DNA_START=14 /DNA_END=376 /DNA_ORIENTATION=-